MVRLTSTLSIKGSRPPSPSDGELLVGALHSRTALRLIREWSLAHRPELEANWNRVEAGEPLERIAPLD
jgi:hypothetical protein